MNKMMGFALLVVGLVSGAGIVRMTKDKPVEVKQIPFLACPSSPGETKLVKIEDNHKKLERYMWEINQRADAFVKKHHIDITPEIGKEIDAGYERDHGCNNAECVDYTAANWKFCVDQKATETDTY